eukprot:2779108-Pleurochrysis_carterae.AAC.1
MPTALSALVTNFACPPTRRDIAPPSACDATAAFTSCMRNSPHRTCRTATRPVDRAHSTSAPRGRLPTYTPCQLSKQPNTCTVDSTRATPAFEVSPT